MQVLEEDEEMMKKVRDKDDIEMSSLSRSTFAGPSEKSFIEDI